MANAPLAALAAAFSTHFIGSLCSTTTQHAHISKDFYVGDEAWGFGPVLDVRRTVDRGVITDYEDFGRIMRQVLEEEMHLSKEEIMDSPVFITEVPFNPKANREAMTRALFDNLNVAALYVANTSSLGLFASGRVTGVVVDIGVPGL